MKWVEMEESVIVCQVVPSQQNDFFFFNIHSIGGTIALLH